jgi:hypothetical protein
MAVQMSASRLREGRGAPAALCTGKARHVGLVPILRLGRHEYAGHGLRGTRRQSARADAGSGRPRDAATSA